MRYANAMTRSALEVMELHSSLSFSRSSWVMSLSLSAIIILEHLSMIISGAPLAKRNNSPLRDLQMTDMSLRFESNGISLTLL